MKRFRHTMPHEMNWTCANHLIGESGGQMFYRLSEWPFLGSLSTGRIIADCTSRQALDAAARLLQARSNVFDEVAT